MARPKTVGPPVLTAEVTIDPGAVTNATGLDITATVNGLRKGHPVVVWATALEDNLTICNAHASAANTLKFRLLNPSAARCLQPLRVWLRILFFALARKRGRTALNIAPLDQRVQLYGEVAVVSFGLESDESVGRRSIILRKIGNDWRIAHFHASSVDK